MHFRISSYLNKSISSMSLNILYIFYYVSLFVVLALAGSAFSLTNHVVVVMLLVHRFSSLNHSVRNQNDT